jgi:hypothetical protein
MSLLRHLTLLALVSAATACSSSSFTSTWVNTQAKPVDMTGKKVLAVVQVREDSRRRASEDALARELTSRGAQGIPSYTIFPSNIGVDTVAAKKIALDNQIAGVVIMRLVAKEQEVSSSPTYVGGYYGSPYYGSTWGAWGGGWGSPYVTETVRTDTKVLVETKVYSLEQNLLVWAGTSETWNPTRSDDVIRELSAAVSGEMQRARLIARTSK